MDKLVSVVIPVYNGAEHVGQAIRSVLEQSYREIEIIVVNDGSDDDGATARACAAFGSSIRYYEKPNGGVASALNLGIRKMSGAYFSWLSHDDRFVPSKIELQTRLARACRSDRLVVLGDWRNVDANDRFLRTKTLPELPNDGPAGHGWYCILRGHLNGSTMLIPRSQIERHGLFDEGLRYVQDYDYWLRLLESCEFRRMPIVLVVRRMHEAQLSMEPERAEEEALIWRRVLHAAPLDARLWAGGSEYRFFADMARRLASNGNPAARWAESEATAAMRAAVVSVVILSGTNVAQMRRTVQSVLDQDHEHVELILVGADESLPPQGVDGMKCLPGAFDSVQEARCAGLEHATGDYVVFLAAGDTCHTGRIKNQVSRMQELGETVSICRESATASASSAEPDCERAELDDLAAGVSFSTVMAHRRVLTQPMSPQAFGSSRLLLSQLATKQIVTRVNTAIVTSLHTRDEPDALMDAMVTVSRTPGFSDDLFRALHDDWECASGIEAGDLS